jgi:hypothetical protein
MEVKSLQPYFLFLRRLNALILFFPFLFFASTVCSQTAKTARTYFILQQDSAYQHLILKRMQQGSSALDTAELHELELYENQLERYFKSLPEKEQANYFRYRKAWEKEPGSLPNNTQELSNTNLKKIDTDYNGNRIRYMFYALQGGFIYGMTTYAYIPMDITNANAQLAIPAISTLGSVLVPAVWNKRYGNMSYPAFRFGSHGISMGPFYGVALSGLILGDEINNRNLNSSVTMGQIAGLTIMSGATVAASIASFNWGKNRGWHDSRALTMRTYARIGCLAGLIMPSREVFRVSSQDGLIRAQSFQFLAGATVGYGVAHILDRGSKVIRSRGEAIVAESFTFQGIGPGLVASFLLDGRNQSSFLLVPAGMATFGILSHWVTRGSNLTPKQGREVAIASWAANASINLITIIAVNEANSFSLIPASIGSFFAAYWLSRRFKKLNASKLPTSKKISSGHKKQVLFTVLPAIRNTTAFHPQSLLKANAIRPEASLSIRF